MNISIENRPLWTATGRGKHLLEGPVLSPDGATLYFTNYFQGHVYSLPTSALTSRPTLVHSYRRLRCNGMKFLPTGRLAVCLTKKPFTLAKSSVCEFDLKASMPTERVSRSIDNKKFHLPNDVVVDEKGGIYFTDLRLWKGRVYYHRTGNAVPIIENLRASNGIELQRNQAGNAESLFVAESGRSRVMQYKIDSPGVVSKPDEFHNFGSGAVDGIKLDKSGNLFVACKTRVAVVNSSGNEICNATLSNPDAIPSNICFIDDSRFVVTSYESWSKSRPAELYLGTVMA